MLELLSLRDFSSLAPYLTSDKSTSDKKIMKNILIAIDNLYAMNDSIISQLEYIDKNYTITVFCVDDVGRKPTIINLVELKKRCSNIKLIQVNRIKNFYDFLRVTLTVWKNFYNKKYIVFLGSNINIEEQILLYCLSKSSIFFGFMITVPPVLCYKLSKLHQKFVKENSIDINLQDHNSNKSNKIKKIYGVLKSKKIIRTVAKSLHYRVNNLLVKLSNKLIILFLDLIGFKVDSKASLNGYVNKGLVKVHFTPNDYYSYVISHEYPGEKVLTYSSSCDVYSKSINEENCKYRYYSSNNIMLLGNDYTHEGNQNFISAVEKVKKISNISAIFIRPHPRFQFSSTDLLCQLKQYFIEIPIVLLTAGDPIEEQIDNNAINIVLGHYSSIISKIQYRKDVIILVDETLIKVAADLRNFKYSQRHLYYSVGSCFGFNKEIAFIDLQGNLYCPLPKKAVSPAEKKSFLQLLNIELSLIENVNSNVGTGQLRRKGRKAP